MNVNGTLIIDRGQASWGNTFGAQLDAPTAILGVRTTLVLDLRSVPTQDAAEAPPYPYEELSSCDSYYIAIDNDYDRATAPKLIRTTGVSVVSEGGRTLFIAELPDTGAVAPLVAAVAANAQVALNCEIGGFVVEGGTPVAAFANSFPLIIRNRVWLGDTTETPDPTEPDWAAAVSAYINAAVASATADLEGDPGPPPVIAIGTVTSGSTADATLTPGDPGEYTLDLTLPAGATGSTGPAPTLAIGTVAQGVADATIEPVTGGYVINLTIPKGDDGIGVVFRGPYDADTLYGLNDAVRQGTTLWRSLQDGSIGNTPPSSGDDAWWETIVRDGITPNTLLRVYDTTDNPSAVTWHSVMQPGDLYFKDSIDGGVTWTAPRLISVGRDVMVRYNIDATTDWTPLERTSPSDDHSSGSGKYLRVRREDGVFGEGLQIHTLAPQPLKAQFSDGSTPTTWHATLQPGDRQVRFYNATSTISQTVIISNGTFDIAEIQLADIINPWHSVYAVGDRYYKQSTDGGLTYGLPIPLYGGDAYQAWLDEGNAGTRAEFLDSLKGATGEPGETGDTGDTGPAGPANSLAIGTVAQGTAAATITGTAPTQTLNLTLPKGDKGDKGDTGNIGATGPANTLSIGTVAGGETAAATITGTAPAQTLNLTLPKGDKGDKGDAGEPLEDNYIEVTSADVTAGNIVIPGDTAPVSVEIAGVMYDLEYALADTGEFLIPLAPILAEANLAALTGTWKIWRAGGKKGDTGSTGGTFAIAQLSALPGTPDSATLYLIAP